MVYPPPINKDIKLCISSTTTSLLSNGFEIVLFSIKAKIVEKYSFDIFKSDHFLPDEYTSSINVLRSSSGNKFKIFLKVVAPELMISGKVAFFQSTCSEP